METITDHVYMKDHYMRHLVSGDTRTVKVRNPWHVTK